MGGLISTLADAAFRDFETNGVPASGPHDPIKLDIRTTFDQIDSTFALTATFAAAGVMFATLAAMNADLAHPAGTPALVYNDPTSANNGVYAKLGASGAGSWQATGIALPSSADMTALLKAVPIHNHTCQVAQLKMQLVTNGTFQQVSNAIPASPQSPVNQQWANGGFVTPTGPLGVQIGTTLALNAAALQALFDSAANVAV